MSHRALMLIGLLATLSAAAQNSQQPEQRRRIPVSVQVESEGPNGLSAQSAHELPEAQLRELEKLIKSLFSRDDSLTVVDASDSKSGLHVTVVAGHVAGTNGRSWIIASSAVIIANDANSLGSHDVIAGPDLQSVTRSVSYLFSSFKFRVQLGLYK